MDTRERVRAMLDFSPVDRAPLEYHPNRRGLYDHGEALRRMIKTLPGDFEDFSDEPIPQIPEGACDEKGLYHEQKTDAWGVEWEYRIFSMAGQAKKYPLADLSALSSYRPPVNPYADPESFRQLRAQVQRVKQYGYCKMGWAGFFEILHALRPFEDVLMDMLDDTDEINAIADLIVDQQLSVIHSLLEAGVDAIQFGDDFGTQRSLMMTSELWRHFFAPRYRRMIAPVKAAGRDVFFHTCGYSTDILPDLRKLGVDAVWPQLSVYDLKDLAAMLRELHLACALHIDRAHTMTHGTPAQVEEAVHAAAKAFAIEKGGSWFYVEIDNGFPLENIEALLKSINTYRNVRGAHDA